MTVPTDSRYNMPVGIGNLEHCLALIKISLAMDLIAYGSDTSNFR